MSNFYAEVSQNQSVNDWVIINYQQSRYVVNVIVIDHNDQELQVNFLKTRGRRSTLTLHWLKHQDIQWVRPQGTTAKINEQLKIRGGFRLDQTSTASAEEAAMTLGQAI